MEFLKGRANRANYLLQLSLLVAIYAAIIASNTKPSGAEVVVAFAVIPRLHDLGRTGWWFATVIVGEIALVGWALAIGANSETILQMGGAYVFGVLALLIVLGAIPGQKEANRFGPPPGPGLQWTKRKVPEPPSDG